MKGEETGQRELGERCGVRAWMGFGREEGGGGKASHCPRGWTAGWRLGKTVGVELGDGRARTRLE